MGKTDVSQNGGLPGRLRWEDGKLIIEIQTVLRVPIALEPVLRTVEDIARIGLTDREKQALQGILNGKSNKEIADVLNISERTVKFHVSTLFTKFTVSSRAEIHMLFRDVKFSPGGDSGER